MLKIEVKFKSDIIYGLGNNSLEVRFLPLTIDGLYPELYKLKIVRDTQTRWKLARNWDVLMAHEGINVRNTRVMVILPFIFG